MFFLHAHEISKLEKFCYRTKTSNDLFTIQLICDSSSAVECVSFYYYFQTYSFSNAHRIQPICEMLYKSDLFFVGCTLK